MLPGKLGSPKTPSSPERLKRRDFLRVSNHTRDESVQDVDERPSRRQSILKKSTFSSSARLSVNEEPCRKKLAFAQTEVHLVENWKKYNKEQVPCCFSFWGN